MALHDARGSGYNDGEKLLRPSTVGALEVKWRFDAADAGHEVGPIHASPVVLDDRVYVGSNLGRFYAIDRDGDMSWTYLPLQPNPLLASLVVPSPIGSPIEAVATPIVGAAVLPSHKPYVIFGDMDGNLYALHRQTGAPVWVKPNVDGHDLGGVIGNSMVLAGDTLIVGFSSIENYGLILAQQGYPCCTFRGMVAAFDVATGAEKWRFRTIPDGEQQALPASLAPFTFGPSGADVWGQPTYDEHTDTVYFGTGQNFSPRPDGGGGDYSDSIVALDAHTGELRWSYQATADDVWAEGLPNPDPEGRYHDLDFGDSPKLYKLPGLGRVVGAGDKAGAYHVLDAETGELVLRTQHLATASALGGFQNLGATAHGLVYQHGLDRIGPVGSTAFKGKVLALTPDGSDVVWSVSRPGSEIVGGLAVAHDVLYFQSPREEKAPGDPPAWALYAVHAKTGAVLKRVELPGRAVSSPVVSRGRVYIGDGNSAVAMLGVVENGGLLCLGLPGNP
ncbi:PQQ-binding-like beta-propeller repeat protein [Nannocystis exedens]|nr:PQQ-binding-like beta-propeller repeat protein [Nannocystis exedens]